MTSFIYLLIFSGLSFAVGHSLGFDKGVRETKAMELLRAAFPLRRMRNR